MTNANYKISDRFAELCSTMDTGLLDVFLGQLTEGVSGEVLSCAMQAAEHIRSGAAAEAKLALIRAMDSSAADCHIYLNLAGIFTSLGEYSCAADAYEQARHSVTDPAFIELRLASLRELAQDYSAAEKHYRNALASKEQHLNAAQGLVSVYMSSGRIRDAWDEIKNIINTYPEKYEGVHLAAALYIASGLGIKAKALLNKARPHFHKRILFHYDYIKALECANEYQEADKYLSNIDDELVRNNLFFAKEKYSILLALDQIDSALQWLEYVCTEFSDLESMYIYGTLLLKIGNTDKALAVLNELINTHAPCLISFKAMYLCASILKHAGRSAESEAAYRRLYQELDAAISGGKPAVPLYVLMAYCCKELDQPDKAAELLRIAEQYCGSSFIEFQSEIDFLTGKFSSSSS